MSTATRDGVTARLKFSHDVASNDLQEQYQNGQYKVHTHTVALLKHLLDNCQNPILITALVDDHHDDSSLGKHGHSGGYSVDLWNADWESKGDAAIENVLHALAKNPYVHKVGLAGYATRFLRASFWPNHIVVFEDGGADHTHVQSHEDVHP